MRRTILVFDEEDRIAAMHAARADDWVLIVTDLDNWLRGRLKYEELAEIETKVFLEVRSHLWDLLTEEGLDPYKEG